MKTVFFDIGNVLTFFKPEKMISQLSSCTGLNEDQVTNILITQNIQRQYEEGKLSLGEIHASFQKKTPKSFSLEDLNEALSNIFSPNLELWPLVEKLKTKGHRLTLLSNTCQSHFQWLNANYSVLKLFDEKILSFEVGFMKPDPRIFERALQSTPSKVEDCFYTDDIPAFVQGARNVGLDSEIFITPALLQTHLETRNYI